MKAISIKVTDEFHKKIKVVAAKKEKTVKQYVTQLIEKDLRKEKE